MLGLLHNQAIPEYPGDAGERQRGEQMHVNAYASAAQGSVCVKEKKNHIYMYLLYSSVFHSLKAQKNDYRDEQRQQRQCVALHVQLVDELTELQRYRVTRH